MSFGFGVGDFLAVGQLCWKVYKKCKDSAGNYAELSSEVGALHNVIKETEELLSQQGLTKEQGIKLVTCRQGCEDVLADLNDLLVRYESLGTKSQRAFDRMGFGTHDMNGIRLRLITNVTMLDAFNNAASHAKLETKLNLLIAEVRAGKREGSVVSIKTFDINQSDREVWEALRKELKDVGVSSEIITERWDFIIAWFQEAVVAGKLEEDAPSDYVDSILRLYESDELTDQSDGDWAPSSEMSSMMIGPPISERKRAKESVPKAQEVYSRRAPSSPPSSADDKENSRTSVSDLLGELRGKGRERQFLDAASAGDVAMIKKLHEKGVEIQARDEHYGPETALHLAARYGKEETVRLLLLKGADVHAKGSGRETALHRAIWNDKEQITRVLLENGADLESKDSFGYTPLLRAVLREQEAVIPLLLEKGANAESKDESGDTALNLAARKGQEKVVRLLLDQRADVNAQGGEYGNAVQAASYWGHDKVVQMLLDEGADVNAQGGENGNAFQAASYRGHQKVVQMLLNKGAVVNAQGGKYGNALHAASSEGHDRVVQMLLDKTADIAAKHEAGWEEDSSSISDLSEVFSVQSSLSSSVSDLSSASMIKEYGSTAAEHLAALLSKDSGFSPMYKAAIAKFSHERFHKDHDQLLKAFFIDLRSETRNSVQLAMVRGLRGRDQRHKITVLIHNKFEPPQVNKQQAMTALRDQESNRKQLLNDYLAERTSALQTDSTMNLRNNFERNKVRLPEHDDEWGDEEANSNSSEDSDDKKVYEHLEPLDDFITRGNAFERFKTNFGYLLRPPTNMSQALKSRDLNVVQRFLARNFASAATSDYEWLHELDEAGHSRREIAELLLEDIGDSPWIYFTPQIRVSHRIQTTFHIPGCAHKASSNARQQSYLYSEDVHSRSLPLHTDVCKQVEELCGIGGVVPSSRDMSTWHGSVTFEDQSSVSVITYAAASANARQSRSDLVKKISNVLANFCAAAAAVQFTGLCCDSFTVLLRMQGCLELRRIELSHAVRMAFYINKTLQDGDTEAAVQQCVQSAGFILQELRMTIPETTPNADLHYCALAAQFLCTAFLSYIQAHIGSVDPFFLDRPQRKMVLLGNQRLPGDFAISAELVELTCLAEMTQQMVFAFSSGATSQEVPLEKRVSRYDVLATAEDLLDTWGPGNLIHNKVDPSKIHAVAMNDGFVSLVDSKIPRFHWAKGTLPESALQVAFEPYTVMRIGAAVSINNKCNIDEASCRSSSFSALEQLGTHEPYWEAKERQVGFQGGQYVTGTCCQTWHKIPGTTLKQRNLEQSDDRHLINFLGQSWGLQVSFCTSVARRVSLRELVADLLPIFVNPLKQDVWRELSGLGIIQAFVYGDLFDWLCTLSDSLRDHVFTLVRTILKQLRHTGLDRQNNTLIIAWPQKDDTQRGLKIPCKAQTCWAQFIADAEDCATFAYMTPKCLETNHLKCQGSSRAWQNASKMLVTEISPSQLQGQYSTTTNAGITTTPAPVTTTVATPKTQWGLEDKHIYFIQKMGSRLWVKVERPSPASNDVAHLVVASSNIPQTIWKRLSVKGEEKRNNRIRERQAIGDQAECVVVRGRVNWRVVGTMEV